jgi:two-component system phosphate regulon sensor histidine kinase PhoR
MSRFRSRKHPAGHMTVLFLAVAAVSVVALVWMGVRLVQQDRALESQQLEERREAAADRVVAALEQVLSAEERRLTEAPLANFLPAVEDALLFTAGATDVRVRPENTLLYYPVIPDGREAPSRLYAAAEKSEFLDRDYESAIRALRSLTQAEDPVVRAGAQLRLARNLRKAGRREAALNVYEELANLSDPAVSISGVPIGLVARRARCDLLEGLGRKEQLQAEAGRLDEGLRSGRWRLDRASYLYYSGQAARWFQPQSESGLRRQALAEGLAWLWRRWQSTRGAGPDAAGRRSLRLNGTSIAVIWRASGERLAAMVAGPDYQKRQWFEPLFQSLDLSRVHVNLLDSDGAPAHGGGPRPGPTTSRVALATGLPWDVVLVNADLEADLSQFAQRRRLMTAGLAILAVLGIAASYLIARAVRRELAASQLQSDFVSAVSHEFRTPLTSMRQFTEMLVEDDNLPAEKRRAFYHAQERSTRRLSRLVESLLDFGRMEAGARPYRLEPLDATQLTQSVVNEFRQETSSDGFVIECNVPKDGAMVMGDQEALAQALWNLLDNAVKYSRDSCTVRVSVEAGSKVAIRVRDEGFGILPSEQGQILRKFTRGSAAKTHGIKGTGIGLAMVKHIVDAHGGKLLVDSEPGKGSTFMIQLPAGG